MCYEDKNNRDWLLYVIPLTFMWCGLSVVLCLCSWVEMSDCGRYVVLYITKGAEPRAKIYYCDLKKVGSETQGDSGCGWRGGGGGGGRGGRLVGGGASLGMSWMGNERVRPGHCNITETTCFLLFFTES